MNENPIYNEQQQMLIDEINKICMEKDLEESHINTLKYLVANIKTIKNILLIFNTNETGRDFDMVYSGDLTSVIGLVERAKPILINDGFSPLGDDGFPNLDDLLDGLGG